MSLDSIVLDIMFAGILLCSNTQQVFAEYFAGVFFMRKRVIIDCDPGIDDSLAIMLAL